MEQVFIGGGIPKNVFKRLCLPENLRGIPLETFGNFFKKKQFKRSPETLRNVFKNPFKRCYNGGKFTVKTKESSESLLRFEWLGNSSRKEWRIFEKKIIKHSEEKRIPQNGYHNNHKSLKLFIFCY